MRALLTLAAAALPLAVAACPPHPAAVTPTPVVVVVPLYVVTYTPAPAPPPAPAAALPVEAGPVARCAACHSGAAADGGGVTLVADGRFTDDPRLRRRSLARLNAGTMPPARDAAGRPVPPLTDGERRSLAGLLSETR